MNQKKWTCISLAVMAMLLAANVSAASIDRTGSFKISYSSAINDGECGERVFDNDTGTKWLTSGGNTTGWMIFDFSEQEAYAIDGYSITSANDAPDRTPKNWTLDGSNDGISWTPVDTRVDEIGWTTFQKRTYTVASPAAYQMYRLNVTANNGSGTLMGFSEMELLEGAVDRTNLPGTVTGSSQLNIREAARAVFDSANRTKWLTASGQTTGWLQFQFANAAAYRINGYAITSANDWSERDPKDWTLEGSNNGTTWTIVDTRTNEFWTGRHQRRLFEFNNFTAYAYYRLNVMAIKNSTATNLMGFAELELLDIDEAPKITAMSPGNFNATSANPLVLEWDSVFNTSAKTYTVNFGTDPNFVEAGALVETGLTANEWTVPETSITDDTIYYWRVDVVDDPFGTGTETFQGPVVKFRVLRETQKVLEWSMDSFGEGTVYAYENPIQHVIATASSQEQSSRSPNRTVGLYGISVNPAILDPNGLGHSTNAADMWISNPDQVGTVWIQYAFDQAYPVGTMHVWNHNVGEPYLSELDRGMRDVIVSYSQDGTNWTDLGSYTIPMGTGQNGAGPSIGINFNGIEAQYVRITAAAANSNWGARDNFHALSEVRFGLYNQPVVSYVMPDMTGSGNDGKTYVDPQLVSEAIAGSAIDLSGDDMVYMVHTDANFIETLPLGTTEDCYDSWSMNFYAVFPNTPPSISFTVGFGGFDTGTGRYIAKFDDGIRFWGGHNIDGVTHVPFDLNRWQMITATYDGGTLRLYKNAEQILEQAVPLGIAPPNASVSGFTAWATRPSTVVGKIDEFSIYKGALSQVQIDLLKAAMPTQYAALNPTPVDGAENIGIDPLLQWEAPLDAIDPTYTVYLGTDPENLQPVASGLTETQFDTIPLGLAYGTTYYWYVDTLNGDASAVWSFTTLPVTAAPQLALGWDFDNTVAYQHTFEAAVENVIATASSYENPTSTGRSPDRAANGIGLWVVPQIADVNALQHSNNATHMWISQPDNPERPWIKFGFDQAYALGTMHVWNHNVGEPWLTELNRGMRDVIVRYGNIDSTEPNDYTILGNYTIPMGTGQNGAAPSIAIPFGGIEAQYVMIQAAQTNSHWGNDRNFHALSEVRFGINGTTASSQAIADTAGNGNEGILYNGPALVNGIGGGTAVRIDPVDSRNISGLSDYINAWIADAAALPLGASDTWSMNLYVNLEANPASPTLLAGFGGTPEGTGRFIGRFNGIHFWGGDNIDVQGLRQYRYGHWQMVTATYSGDTLTLYHNGVELNSGNVAPGEADTFLDAAEFVTIAGTNPWGNRFTGLVDDFTLYKGVLSRAQIAALAAVLPMAGDMDWNDTVDVLDLPTFVQDWLVQNDETSPSDFTGDRNVDLEDFAVLAGNWMKVQ